MNYKWKWREIVPFQSNHMVNILKMYIIVLKGGLEVLGCESTDDIQYTLFICVTRSEDKRQFIYVPIPWVQEKCDQSDYEICEILNPSNYYGHRLTIKVLDSIIF